MNISNRFRSILLGVITAVWATNMIVPVFNQNYQPPAELNGIFTIVAGGIVASYVGGRNNGGGSGGSGSGSGSSGGTNGSGGGTP